VFAKTSNIIFGSKASGVNILITDNDQMQIVYVIVERKGNRLTCSNFSNSLTPEELKNKLSTNIPVYLSIDGKGILHKISESKLGVSAIDSIFPDAKSSDFLVQETLLDGNRRIISAIRQSKADEILKIITAMGYNVLKVTLGPFSVINISDSFPDETSIELPYYNIFLKQGKICGFEKIGDLRRAFSIDIDSQVLQSEFIVPFTSCLFHFRGNESISVEYDPIHLQKENFKFRKLFQLAGWGLLLFFFCTLLVNYFLFENLREQNAKISANINANKEVLTRIAKLKNQLKVKEGLLTKNLSFNNFGFAYYFDRIAQSVPNSITLSRFCISPAMISQVDRESIKFQRQRILISGYAFSSKNLDSWIKSVRTLSWINDIAIKSFTDNNIDVAKFDLEISINESLK
jgi:hypothetical protein